MRKKYSSLGIFILDCSEKKEDFSHYSKNDIIGFTFDAFAMFSLLFCKVLCTPLFELI